MYFISPLAILLSMEHSNPNPKLIHTLEDDVKPGIKLPSALVFFFIVILLGLFAGYTLNYFRNPQKQIIGNKQTKTSKSVGVTDKKTFKDQAEGLLKDGGVEGEGNFHLERPGGESQNVYLTSSTVDLSQYVGKKVRVWGATFKGQKAGWLMDVGLVEIP